MRGKLLKALMVILVLIPVGLTAYLANHLYHRKGVPEAIANLTRQVFQSKEDERKAEKRAEELEHKATELQTAYDALVADLRGEVDNKEIRVRQFREKLEINFIDKILFASGSAEVTPHGREILQKVSGILAKVKNKSIYVVGHTDTKPIHSALYPSNWELSTARSSAVIRFLSETGNLAPERFTAMGRAFYQPVASNATPEGRQANRRVDIIVADVPLLANETMTEKPEASTPDTVAPGGTNPGDAPAVQATPLRETAPAAPPEGRPDQQPSPETETPEPAQPTSPTTTVPPALPDQTPPPAPPEQPAAPPASGQ